MVRKHPPRLGRGLDSLVSRLHQISFESRQAGQETTNPSDEPKPSEDERIEDNKEQALSQARSTGPGILESSKPDDHCLETTPILSTDKRHEDVTVGVQDAELEAKPLSGKRPVFPEAMVRVVPVNELRPNPYQPRAALSPQQISELAKSVAESGILQPIVSRETTLGQLEIIAGERRWRAARAAGLATVPVIVRRATDREMHEWALIENIHREDLNAMDRARAYRRYCDAFDLTAQQVADRLGEDRTTVANYLRLVDLPGEITLFLESGRMSMGHGRALLGVADLELQLRLATEAVRGNVSVRQLEGMVRRARQKAGRLSREACQQDTVVPRVDPFVANIRDLEARFERALGTHVQIERGKKKGSGRIIIEYRDLEEFERVGKEVGLKFGE